MEDLVEKGLVKSIGLSNFGVQLIWDILSYCKIKPSANQIEIQPLYNNAELVRYCLGNNIAPVAYCPLLGGQSVSEKTPDVFKTEVILSLSEKYSKTP